MDLQHTKFWKLSDKQKNKMSEKWQRGHLMEIFYTPPMWHFILRKQLLFTPFMLWIVNWIRKKVSFEDQSFSFKHDFDFKIRLQIGKPNWRDTFSKPMSVTHYLNDSKTQKNNQTNHKTDFWKRQEQIDNSDGYTNGTLKYHLFKDKYWVRSNFDNFWNQS